MTAYGTEGDQAQDPANEQEHYRRAHSDDLAKPASWLLTGEILYLHPSRKLADLRSLGWAVQTNSDGTIIITPPAAA